MFDTLTVAKKKLNEANAELLEACKREVRAAFVDFFNKYRSNIACVKWKQMDPRLEYGGDKKTGGKVRPWFVKLIGIEGSKYNNAFVSKNKLKRGGIKGLTVGTVVSNDLNTLFVLAGEELMLAM